MNECDWALCNGFYEWEVADVLRTTELGVKILDGGPYSGIDVGLSITDWPY